MPGTLLQQPTLLKPPARAGTDGTAGGPGGTPLTPSVVTGSQSGGIPAWAPTTVYPVNVLVSNGGTNYICKTAHTSGGAFDASKFTALGAGASGDPLGAAVAAVAAGRGVRLQVPVTDGCSYPFYVGPTAFAGLSTILDRAATSCTYKSLPITAKWTGTNVTAEFTNSGITVNGEDDGWTTITLAASIIDSDGVTIHRFKFGGAFTTTLAIGQRISTDGLTDLVLTKDKRYYILTFVDAGGGNTGHWPATMNMTTDITNGSPLGSGYASGVDATATGTMTNTTTTSQQIYGYGPSVIRADPVDGAKVAVAIYGDSIESTAAATGATATPNEDLFSRALHAAGATTVRLAMSGNAWGDATTIPRRGAIAHGCSVALCAHGTNNIRGGGVTLATVQAQAISMWNAIKAFGHAELYQTTVWPASSGGAGSQTTGPGETVRRNFNAWLRDGAPILAGVAAATGSSAAGTLRAADNGHPLTNYVEIADLVEPSRDAGIWIVAYYSDGVHPAGAGQDAAQVAVDVNKLGGRPLTLPELNTKLGGVLTNQRRKTGSVYPVMAYGSTNNTVIAGGVNNRGACVPFLAEVDTYVDAIGIYMRVAGSAGALIRLGILAAGTDGKPGGGVVVDAGTFDATVITLASTNKTFTKVLLSAGNVYWFVSKNEGAPVTFPQSQVGQNGGGSALWLPGSTISAPAVLSAGENNIAGSFDASALTGYATIQAQSNAPVMFFRIAAPPA